MWVAEHLALGSQVAVKLIDPELAKQDDARERFAREATAAAKLRSSHVVHILDHGIEGEQPFIVMELLEGEDLFDRLERRKRLTLPETSKILTQVARALMRAHAEGIIHRDLKPENVFLVRNEDDELAKVLDFGVAKITTPAKATMTRTGVGTLIGTPHYMSPEQVKGLTEIDHRSDLWSLGVIAYQCVTGQLPFDSEGVGDLLIRITMNEPAKPSSIVPDIAPVFDEWFKKASAKEPEDRFQTAREMADALARAVGVQTPMSQPGRVLVSLGDSPDLDWGSLAGVRIPVPPKKVIVTGAAAASRAPTLDGNDLVELDEGWGDEGEATERPADSAPPPSAKAVEAAKASEPEAPPPSVRARPPAPPPPPSRATPAPPPVSDNPFLAVAGAPPPSSRQPSVRTLHSTVTGLASTSQPAPPLDVVAEPSRRRRAVWFVVTAVLLVSVGVTVGVIRSRGGFDQLTNQPPSNAAAKTAVATSQEVTANLGATPPVITPSQAPSTTASDEAAVDLNVTKKPSAKPSVTAPPP
ncbi:MAG: protein kinase, partial [Myxococcales bacterium]|nr:protein kinase [Myxococcales bacterium]